MCVKSKTKINYFNRSIVCKFRLFYRKNKILQKYDAYSTKQAFSQHLTEPLNKLFSNKEHLLLTRTKITQGTEGNNNETSVSDHL